MARPDRYFVEGQPLHGIRRGNDRTPVFFACSDSDRDPADADPDPTR